MTKAIATPLQNGVTHFLRIKFMGKVWCCFPGVCQSDLSHKYSLFNCKEIALKYVVSGLKEKTTIFIPSHRKSCFLLFLPYMRANA